MAVIATKMKDSYKICGVSLTKAGFIFFIASVIILFCMFIVVLSMGVRLSNLKSASSAASNNEVCESESCLEVASFLSQCGDRSADPCDDFYAYACGSFARNFPVPAMYPQWSVTDGLLDQNKERIRIILESDVNSDTWITGQKAKKLFQSCMRDYETMKAGADPFIDVVSELGGWNVLGNFEPDNWEFQSALNKIHIDHWANAFFLFRVSLDPADWVTKQIYLSSAGFNMYSYQNYVGQDEYSVRRRTAYINYIERSMKLFLRDAGVPSSDEKLKEFSDWIILAESQLANYSLTGGQAKMMTLSELTVSAPSINWFAFFKLVFPSVTADTSIYVSRPDYMTQMSYLINTWSKEEQNDYMMWQLAFKYIEYISYEFAHVWRMYQEEMSGTTQFSDDYTICFNMIIYEMKEGVGSLFVREHFNKIYKSDVEDAINNMRTGIKPMIDSYEWMTNEEKEIAKKKIEFLRMNIGFPDYYLDDREMDKIYNKLIIKDENSFFENYVSLNAFKRQETQDQYEGTIDTSWGSLVWQDFGQYVDFKNLLEMPAGVMQPPIYYGPDKYPYLSHGPLHAGYIGSKLFETFDKFGSQYNEKGERTNWWSNKTTQEFEKRNQCVLDMYNVTYKIGNNSQSLNLPYSNVQRTGPAEIGSVKLAFQQYKQLVSSSGIEELSLPGYGNVTPEQGFFVFYATRYCQNLPESTLAMFLYSGIAPNDLIVKATLKQSEDFARVFNCPKSSKMVSENRCNVF